MQNFWFDFANFFRSHNKGGHFAATELPEVLADDVLEFVNSVENGLKQTKKNSNF